MEDKKLMPDSYYEERRIAIRWRQNTLPSAGIWLVDGRWQVAMYGSPAEEKLREHGGILVAGVVFDRTHGERPVAGDVTLDPYPAADLPKLGKQRAIETLGWAPASN
jgi:hypothetical protein